MSASRLRVFHGDAAHCELCDHSPLEEFVVPGSTVLWRCAACGLYQKGPLVDSSAYADEYHAGYERHRRKKLRTAMVRLHRIAPLVEVDEPRLLDVGSSVGCVVEAALNRGWQAVGTDVSPSAVQFCRGRGLRCRLFDGGQLPFDDGSFDVVTSWHVIEHVADVEETLADWFRVLRPGGVLALETPDAASPIVRRRGAKYRKFWAPEHTYAFTAETLGAFMERTGFTVLRRPLFGRLGQLPINLAVYVVAYQSYQGLRKLAGIGKAFQIFARKPAAADSRRLRVAA